VFVDESGVFADGEFESGQNGYINLCANWIGTV
jgi:hypothetical protein